MTRELVLHMARQLREHMIAGETDKMRAAFVPGKGSLTHITGFVQPLEDWLTAIDNGDMVYFGAKEEAATVALSGQTAQVVIKQRLDARIWGSRNVWPLTLTYQLRKQSDEWRIETIVANLY